MYTKTKQEFTKLVEESSSMKRRLERVPVSTGRSVHGAENDRLRCRFCGASVTRRSVLPGGYCPVCER